MGSTCCMSNTATIPAQFTLIMLTARMAVLVCIITIVPVSSGQGQGFREEWQNVLSQRIREIATSSAEVNVTLGNTSSTLQNITDTTGAADDISVTSPESTLAQNSSNRVQFAIGNLPSTITSQGTESVSATPTTISGTVSENEHSKITESSSAAHVPNEEVLVAERPVADAHPQLDEPLMSDVEESPSIRQMEEPIAPPSEETRERGSLPLVLGAAIVVIFGFGVAGATITATCRKRKMKKKGDIESANSGDINHMSMKSNSMRSNITPVFTLPDKQRNSLALALNTFPPNSSIYRDMKFASNTASPH